MQTTIKIKKKAAYSRTIRLDSEIANKIIMFLAINICIIAAMNL